MFAEFLAARTSLTHADPCVPASYAIVVTLPALDGIYACALVSERGGVREPTATSKKNDEHCVHSMPECASSCSDHAKDSSSGGGAGKQQGHLCWSFRQNLS